MKRKVQKPLVLDEVQPAIIDEPAIAEFVDAEPDADLDMVSAPEDEHAIPEDLLTAEPKAAPAARARGSSRARKVEPPPSEPAPAPEPEEPEIAFQPERQMTRAARTEAAAEAPMRILPPPPAEKGSRVGYVVAAVLTLVWAAVPLAFFTGYARRIEPFTYEPFTIALLTAWAIGSVGILWIAARLLRQSLRLGAEVRYARAQAEDLLTPAAIAAAGAGSAVQVVRREIDSAVAAAAQARHELMTLREVLASETARLVEAAEASARTAQNVTGALGAERSELTTLSETLSGQVAQVEDAIGRQARMVAEASDLAETQIREAEATLTARAADLAAAAGDATDAARTASEDLARQAAKLESAGTGVTEQIRNVEEGLAEQRAALVSVAVSLRAEQEDFAAQVESQQAQLSEILIQTRAASQDIAEATGASGESLRQLIQSAAEQYREVAEATHEERDLFGASTLQALGALSEAARQERQLMTEETEQAIQALSEAAVRAQAATEAQAEAAQARIDELGEAAFAAGQKADAVFDRRLEEARALIEASADLIEEAGQRTNERLAASLEQARGTVEQLEGLLREVDARTAALPADAARRGEEVRAAVEQGVEELMSAARRAADETQAIDAAFQERVKRNYEMLSEAVRMMGVVGGSSATGRTLRGSRLGSAGLSSSPLANLGAPSPTAEEAGLRPRRLRLTPTAPVASDAEFDSALEAAAPSAPAAAPAEEAPLSMGEDWTWKELLSDIEEPAAPAADAEPAKPSAEIRPPPQMGGRMASEISSLGIDPLALLPRNRTDEIAAVLQAGDTHGAREVVRRLAPAAMRRLSRRVLMDPTLKGNALQFIRDYEGVIDDAAEADRDGAALASLMASDSGRAFLLLDAAIGDVG